MKKYRLTRGTEDKNIPLKHGIAAITHTKMLAFCYSKKNHAELARFMSKIGYQAREYFFAETIPGWHDTIYIHKKGKAFIIS